MAFTKDFSITRNNFGVLTKTPLTRGLLLNGRQVEFIKVKKLTGDTAGSVALETVQRAQKVYVLPLTDAAGAVLTAEPTMVDGAFTHTNNTTLALTGLGDWTAAYLLVVGRSWGIL